MENFTGVIRAKPCALKENKNLVERSIVQSYKENHFRIYMVNIRSLRNKIIDLEKDIYAQKADHVCVVETWINPNYQNDLRMEERLVFCRLIILIFVYILYDFHYCIAGHFLMHLMERKKDVPFFLRYLNKYQRLSTTLLKKTIK